MPKSKQRYHSRCLVRRAGLDPSLQELATSYQIVWTPKQKYVWRIALEWAVGPIIVLLVAHHTNRKRASSMFTRGDMTNFDTIFINRPFSIAMLVYWRGNPLRIGVAWVQWSSNIVLRFQQECGGLWMRNEMCCWISSTSGPAQQGKQR